MTPSLLDDPPHAHDVRDVVIIGGGPAGAAIGRLLALWGHDVCIIARDADASRGLAESLPPSTTKLLTQIGVVDDVERACALRTSGNTSWWASNEQRVERFDAPGYQVFRPDLDRALLDSAAAAGASVLTRTLARRVTLDSELAGVEHDGGSVSGRFVVDCSGRAGVVGRRFRVPQPGFRTCALVGVWNAREWRLPDATHTVVETFADGWAWSVPIDAITRHVGAMVGHAMPEDGRAHDLTATYRAQLAKAVQMSRLVQDATLDRVFACDASLYSATRYGGDNFLLVGDAGSFIDPLSSFGVKKALGSAWLGAVALHTALAHPERRSMALDYFSNWERRLYATHLGRSCEFAQAACGRHPDAFWSARAEARLVSDGTGQDALESADGPEVEAARDPGVLRAFERLKAASTLDLALSESAHFPPRPVVRDREIVLEPALEGGMRFLANVDLLKLARIAPTCRHVPDVFEAYCRSCPPVPLPSVIGGLSLLVARGILYERS